MCTPSTSRINWTFSCCPPPGSVLWKDQVTFSAVCLCFLGPNRGLLVGQHGLILRDCVLLRCPARSLRESKQGGPQQPAQRTCTVSTCAPARGHTLVLRDAGVLLDCGADCGVDCDVGWWTHPLQVPQDCWWAPPTIALLVVSSSAETDPLQVISPGGGGTVR